MAKIEIKSIGRGIPKTDQGHDYTLVSSFGAEGEGELDEVEDASISPSLLIDCYSLLVPGIELRLDYWPDAYLNGKSVVVRSLPIDAMYGSATKEYW